MRSKVKTEPEISLEGQKSEVLEEIYNGSTDFETKRLYIKFTLACLVLTVFGALLILIFYVEVPSSMETLCATMLGGLISTVHAVISHFFDSTDHAEREKDKRGATEKAKSRTGKRQKV